MFGEKSVFQYLIIFICFYFSGNYPTPPPSEIKWAPEKWTDIFLVVPVICFGYQCHVSVIPIYSCMKNRNLKHFSGKKVYHGKFLLSWNTGQIISNIWHWFCCVLEGEFKRYEKIQIPRRLFEGRYRKGKELLPDWLN